MGALDEGERVTAADAAAWRAWLSDNHATSNGAWLVRPRPGNQDAHVGYEDAILQALCFGWIDGPVRTFDERIGGLWFAPRRASSGWAATNKARIAALEEAGLLEAAGIRAIEAARENGSWTVLDGPGGRHRARRPHGRAGCDHPPGAPGGTRSRRRRGRSG